MSEIIGISVTESSNGKESTTIHLASDFSDYGTINSGFL